MPEDGTNLSLLLKSSTLDLKLKGFCPTASNAECIELSFHEGW